jgi:hypothetical protein
MVCCGERYGNRYFQRERPFVVPAELSARRVRVSRVAVFLGP